MLVLLNFISGMIFSISLESAPHLPYFTYGSVELNKHHVLSEPPGSSCKVKFQSFHFFFFLPSSQEIVQSLWHLLAKLMKMQYKLNVLCAPGSYILPQLQVSFSSKKTLSLEKEEMRTRSLGPDA